MKKYIHEKQIAMLMTLKQDLPAFVKAVDTEEGDCILLHQDAFAADYQYDEFTLLGMAIKYAGLKGKEVRIIGKNGQTLEK